MLSSYHPNDKFPADVQPVYVTTCMTPGFFQDLWRTIGDAIFVHIVISRVFNSSMVYIFSEYRNEKWSVFMFLWCNKGVYHIDAHEAIWPQANVYRQLGTPTQYPLSTAYRTCFLYYSHTFSLFLFSDSLQFPGLLCQQSVILCLLKG